MKKNVYGPFAIGSYPRKLNEILHEVEKVAITLEGLSFDIFYQANNTAFSGGALLRLYKISSNELYLDLSYMYLTSLCKMYSSGIVTIARVNAFQLFFALFPLSDARIQRYTKSRKSSVRFMITLNMLKV